MDAQAAKILVVEDEALIMMATVDMLCDLGHEPLTARSAAAALAIVDEAKPIDLVITDVNLPDMNGQALAAEIRRRRPGLPVVFATGYTLKIEPAVAASGPTAVLGKPFSQADLERVLSKVGALAQPGFA